MNTFLWVMFVACVLATGAYLNASDPMMFLSGIAALLFFLAAYFGGPDV